MNTGISKTRQVTDTGKIHQCSVMDSKVNQIKKITQIPILMELHHALTLSKTTKFRIFQKLEETADKDFF